MADSPDANPRAPDEVDCPHCPTAFCLTFLSDHDQAAAGGRPLLTEAGVEYLQQHLDGGRAARPADNAEAGPPRWDPDWRRLFLGDRLLREFRQPAPHQTAILAAFADRGWGAARIPDPLPREPGDTDEEARQRLYETVKNLNRGLPPGTVRFHVDGDAVWWEHAGPAAGGDPE